jgi:hypothetical protein
LKFDQHCTWLHLSVCDMSSSHTTPTHPSHHTLTSIPAPADAPQSTPLSSEESVPFTEVIGRSKKARNAHAKRVSSQQTTLTFAGAPPPPPASPALAVSVDIAGRVEETTEYEATSARIDQRPADRATALAATAGIRETGRKDQLTSSSRATQHSSSTLSRVHSSDTATRAAQSKPSTPSLAPQPGSSFSAPPPHTSTPSSNGVELDDDRMRDVAAAAKRARELDTTLSGSATTGTSTNGGQVHPDRQHLVGRSTSGSAAYGNGKEEADQSSGQDKRRRTAPQHSISTSSSSTSAARSSPAPTAEEFNELVAELHASRKEADALRARLEQLERRIETSLPASLPASGVVPPALIAAAVPALCSGGAAASSVAPSATSTGNGSSSHVPAPSTQAAKHAAATATVAGSGKVTASPAASRNQRAPHYSLAEPKASLLSSLSLSPYSTTDLMLDIRLPPTTIKMARGHFPNHTTQPANHRMGIVNLLQNADGVQLNPPRVPLFVTKAHGERDSIVVLQHSYAPDSREYRYLDGIQQAEMNGDEYDPCQHTFTTAECVTTWHQLLTLDTRVVASQHQRKLCIRLALSNPVLTAAVRAAVAAHVQHVELLLAGRHSKQAGAAARFSMTSPTPSVASTTSASSSEELALSDTSSMEEDTQQANSEHNLAQLSHAAMHCTVSVSPFRLRYAMCTISNWPRAHPTELCAGNEQLTAFAHRHAPDVRLVTKEEHGMTSVNVTAYCQQRHLSQLAGLNGRVSVEHGIHYPLRLHTTIHVMGAKTCTFCWQPNHGAAQCPRRASNGNAAQPVPTHPACRQCYSFAHTAEACTSTVARVCTLCKKEGHCTSQCTHFFPSRLPLQQYLKPAANTQQQQQLQRRAATDGKGDVPAPILSSALSSAARAWQPVTAASAGAPSTMSPHTSSPPAHPQPTKQPSMFVTLDQLNAVLAPVLLALQQLQGACLFSAAATAANPSPASTAVRPHPLL